MNVWVFNTLIHCAFYKLAHFHLEAIIVDDTVISELIIYNKNPQITNEQNMIKV